jgi:hypothetical protein
MRFAFDLWSCEDVSASGAAIFDKLSAGAMPCDGAWPSERVGVFRRWMAMPPLGYPVAGPKTRCAS